MKTHGPPTDKKGAKFVLNGEALDQETIVRLRPKIEYEARTELGDFKTTKLYWNMLPNGHFAYEIYFYD